MGWGPILAPLDGSPRSEAALPYAVALAAVTGAAMELISVAGVEPRQARSARELPKPCAGVEQSASSPVEEYVHGPHGTGGSTGGRTSAAGHGGACVSHPRPGPTERTPHAHCNSGPTDRGRAAAAVRGHG